MTETRGAAIAAEGISKRFGRVQALDNVSLTVPDGSMFALLGPNGAGKSTMIDILCTIRPPDSGRALVAGHDVAATPLKVRKAIGVVFQDPTVDTRLTVRENLDFHGLVYQMGGAHRRRRIAEMLELVELADRADAVVRTLSSGMKRRLEIARALLHEPRVLFLDEPTVGLDAQSRARIWDYLRDLRGRSDLTIVVTTHYIDEVEACDHVCVIDGGKILADDTPAALKTRFGQTILRVTPANPAAAADLRARFPEALTGAKGQVLVPLAQPDAIGPLLAEIGPLVSAIELDQPSLESVFLSLTGRDLREEPASRAKGGRGHGR